MKIRSDINKDTKLFGELKKGDVFKFQNNVYMVVRDEISDHCNVVNLTNAITDDLSEVCKVVVYDNAVLMLND